MAALALMALSRPSFAHGGTMGAPVGPSSGGLIVVGHGGSPSGQVVIDSRDRTWTFGTYGTPTFGGDVGASANATRGYVSGIPVGGGQPIPSNYRSMVSFSARAKLLGSTYDAARFTGKAENEPYVLSSSGAQPKVGYQAKTTLDLKLGTSTIYTDEFSGTTLSKTWTKSWGPIDTPHVSQTFVVVFVPVTLEAWAGVSANASLTASANLASVALALQGHAEGKAYGIGQAGVGIPAASAGVALQLDFANPRVDTTFDAGLFTGIGGSFSVCTTPVRFLVELYAQLRLTRRLSLRATLKVAEWAMPEQCASFSF